MYPAVPDRHLPSITPLTARSVALSTLLGYHPPALPISALVKVGELLGIADRATRVALTRMVKDGDVTVDNGVYRLSERLLRRQAQQDALTSPPTRRWTGGWEMAIVTSTTRPLAERVALRKSMVRHRMGELREGVWMRPDNLSRELDGVIAEPGSVALGLARMGGRGGPIADGARRGRESRPRVHRYSGGNPTPAARSVSAGRAAPIEVARQSTSRALHRFQRQLFRASPKVQRRIVGAEAPRAPPRSGVT